MCVSAVLTERVLLRHANAAAGTSVERAVATAMNCEWIGKVKMTVKAGGCDKLLGDPILLCLQND